MQPGEQVADGARTFQRIRTLRITSWARTSWALFFYFFVGHSKQILGPRSFLRVLLFQS